MDVATADPKELLNRANEIRRGADEDPNIAFAIAKRLANRQYLEYARRLGEHIRDDPRFDARNAIRLRQLLALWTSKNPDAPEEARHYEALNILDSIAYLPGGASLRETEDGESLGIAGGICKRLWMADGQIGTLERSLQYYERGAARGVAYDQGYTAINAAFTHDLLASMEGEHAEHHRAEAKRYRLLVIDNLTPLIENLTASGAESGNLKWLYQTIAEAAFGLGDFDRAREWLAFVDWKGLEPWEYETTARQFAWLARLIDPASTEEEYRRSAAWRVLQESFNEKSSAAAQSLFAGKLGLALSGGGFRASLYHIGVLAALAERNLLRHVEVLSCVSGGSIIGAHYYLEVRRLLNETRDEDITDRAPYVEIVERMARDFLAGVQKNIRTRIVFNPITTVRMMLSTRYSRTNRLGELYEKHIYARVPDRGADGRQERRLRELLVRPKGWEQFRPKYDNWRRANKVPILVLNATTLNTGHNWQFTATWMGEPPSQIEQGVDGNFRLRRMYLADEAPGIHKDISIGQAVAASSCVPGLFAPLALHELYEGKTVRLVDGGVHDNQGIFSLLDQNCGVIIVSDASGQMSTVDKPGKLSLPVVLRSSSTQAARIRISQFRELESRRKSIRLKQYLFLHLKEDLDVEDIDWIACDNPKELSASERSRRAAQLTRYGILKALQERIANIRTDLDSFSDIEAYTLMTSGYNMAVAGIEKNITGFALDRRPHDWKFLRIAARLRSPAETSEGGVLRWLEAAKSRGFKIWRLSRLLRIVSTIAGLLCAGGLIVWLWDLKTLIWAAWILGGVIVAIPVIAIGGMLAGVLHVSVFDRAFLKNGKLKNGE